jgi:transcription elongation factor Elf1
VYLEEMNMAIWIDQKYINLLSNRLQYFKQKDRDLFNFRCPVCGDSKKSKTKSRGWIFLKGAKFRFYCHNCSASMTFSSFLKSIDVVLHQEYLKDVFLENKINLPTIEVQSNVTKTIVPKFQTSSPLKYLKKISSLPIEHIAKKYVMARKIPSHVQYKLFYCPNFKAWVNSFLPDKFKDVEKDEARLVIPLLDKDKNFFGCQARSFGNVQPRYITIIADEDKPRVYGLDSIDLNKHVYVFEGPIDSMFIDNSMAMCGADLTKSVDLDKNKCTIVFDNEPRAMTMVNKIAKYIERGYRVCLWPETIKGKDINEMILNGHEPEELKIIIDKNSYQGIQANLQLQMWRKC